MPVAVDVLVLRGGACEHDDGRVHRILVREFHPQTEVLVLVDCATCAEEVDIPSEIIYRQTGVG